MASSPKVIELLPPNTRPSRNSICSGVDAPSAQRRSRHALLDLPRRDLRRHAVDVGPEEAAVGEALGTLAVLVAVMRTKSSGTPNSSATTCATLVNSPCPISVPP